ncbi:hypothetical protein A2U01_0016230 [Trifolium medium]|uniref:Uncharacterized protein n=1 Tax=Trifolium medium TaxID=97028 RepID=A0A392N7Z1_9FABA|nr:hypothetical protein [Trifolium medium]
MAIIPMLSVTIRRERTLVRGEERSWAYALWACVLYVLDDVLRVLDHALEYARRIGPLGPVQNTTYFLACPMNLPKYFRLLLK